METRASPRLILVCESVHAVKKKGKYKVEEENTLHKDKITDNAAFFVTVLLNCLVEYAKKRHSVLLLTLHMPQK